MHSNTKLHVSLLVHYSVTAGLSASREFKHPVGIEPETPDSLLLTLINEPWICVSLQKKNGILLVLFCNLWPLFFFQDCRSHIAQVEYQGQEQNTWILERKPLFKTSYHINIDRDWNIFTLHSFCSLLIEHLIVLETVRTENLKFRTDLRDQVMNG